MDRRTDSGLSVHILAAAVAEPLRPLLELPMGAAWSLATRFGRIDTALALLGEDATAVAQADGGRYVACGIRAVKPVWWCGQSARLGWLALLRRDPTVGRIAGLRALPAVYDALAGLRRSDELPFDLSAIIDGNSAAHRLLTRGLAGLPAYRARSHYRTALWSARTLARRRRGLLRPATLADLPALAALAAPPAWAVLWPRPAWDATALPGLLVAERGGRIVACARLDDQRTLRATVLTAMPAAPAAGRLLLNAWRHLRGLPAIPRRASELPQLHAMRWFWAAGQAGAALEVLAGLAAGADPGAIITAGWPEDHPDAAVLAAAAPHEALGATWFSVGGAETLPTGAWHLETGTL